MIICSTKINLSQLVLPNKIDSIVKTTLQKIRKQKKQYEEKEKSL